MGLLLLLLPLLLSSYDNDDDEDSYSIYRIKYMQILLKTAALRHILAAESDF